MAKFIDERIGNKNSANNKIGPLTLKFEEIVTYLNGFGAPDLLLLSGTAKALHGPKSNAAKMAIAARDPEELKRIQEAELKAKFDKSNEIYNKVVKYVEDSTRSQFNPTTYKAVYDRYLELANKNRQYYVTILSKIPDEYFGETQDILIYLRTELGKLFVQSFTSNIKQPRTLTLFKRGLNSQSYSKLISDIVSSVPVPQNVNTPAVETTGIFSPGISVRKNSGTTKKLGAKAAAGEAILKKGEKRRTNKAIARGKESRQKLFNARRRGLTPANGTGTMNENEARNGNGTANNNNNGGIINAAKTLFGMNPSEQSRRPNTMEEGGRRKTRKNRRN
jgi:hypothetical protein